MFRAYLLFAGISTIVGVASEHPPLADVAPDAAAADDECSLSSGNESCAVGLLQRRSAAQTSSLSNLTMPLVDAVYTYGAPATHVTSFRNLASADGCFPGLRSYTEDILKSGIKQIDAASIFNKYPHMKTASVVLRWKRDSLFNPCGGASDGHTDWPKKGVSVYQEWRLHHENIYRDRLKHITIKGKPMGEQEPFLTARKYLWAAFRAYDSFSTAKGRVDQVAVHWNLVGRVVDKHGDDEDPIILLQHKDSLECVVVFAGTNSFSELFTSTTQYGTGYCGFHGVHVGYRNELWTITGKPWQTLKPKLEQCSRLSCSGHSLGGALCELFAACANSGHVTDPDYQRLAWRKQKARRLKAITGNDFRIY